MENYGSCNSATRNIHDYLSIYQADIPLKEGSRDFKTKLDKSRYGDRTTPAWLQSCILQLHTHTHTWNSHEELDSIPMAVEGQLSLGHGTIGCEGARRHLVSAIGVHPNDTPRLAPTPPTTWLGGWGGWGGGGGASGDVSWLTWPWVGTWWRKFEAFFRNCVKYHENSDCFMPPCPATHTHTHRMIRHQRSTLIGQLEKDTDC